MSSTDWPWYEIVNDDSLDQGDIIQECFVLHAVEGEDEKAVAELRPVTALVVTQTCDLAQSKADSVILCAVWPVTAVVIRHPTLSKEAKETAEKNRLTMPPSAEAEGAEAQIAAIIEKSKKLKKELDSPLPTEIDPPSVTPRPPPASTSMTLLHRITSRFRKFLPLFAAAAVLGSAGGYAAHVYAADDCCHPGAPCCHPGAACCAKHHHA